MVSNYPSDPNNAASLKNNSSGPASGPFDSAAEFPPQSSLSSLSSTAAENGSNQRRLAQGTPLSGGRYTIEKPVAAGGMGAVYRAIDTRFNRPCAVKEMLDEFQNDAERSQAVEWFGREATLLLDLNHPCIPRVRDFFVEHGKHYLVMDYIEGRTLGEVLEKEGNVVGVNGARGTSEARARSWGQQVCSVLAYLHRQSPPIIFRDLKPSNIMVTESDEIKLIDFGIARTFQSQRQATIIMTIGYAPPEQLHGMPEPRSDLYALGATLHRILTHHDAANNKPSIFSFPPVRSLRPDISPAFEQVIMKALAPALDQRWQGAAEIERAIINLPPITIAPPLGAIPATSNASSAAPRSLTPQTPGSGGSGTSQTPGGNGQAGIAGPHTTTGPAGTHIVNALGFMNANRIEEAYTAVQQAWVLEPNNSLVHRIFGQVFARRRPPTIEQAIQAYTRSLQLNSKDPETHKLLADVSLFLRRQPLAAIAGYIQSLRLNPNDIEAHQRLAQCYEETNQLELALREFQEIAGLAPKQVNAHVKVGQLAFHLNQLAAAERAFVTALTLNPADHPTRYLLSQVYESEGKLKDAERECAYVAPIIPAAQPMLQRVRGRLGR
jgi:serine/threonine protein kinase